MKKEIKKLLLYALSVILAIFIISSGISFVLTKHVRNKIEDDCRMLMAEYIEDIEMYERYKNANGLNGLQEAENAKARANTVAQLYNEIIEQNSDMWDGDKPADIVDELVPIV